MTHAKALAQLDAISAALVLAPDLEGVTFALLHLVALLRQERAEASHRETGTQRRVTSTPRGERRPGIGQTRSPRQEHALSKKAG